jgi:hypothetical protein
VSRLQITQSFHTDLKEVTKDSEDEREGKRVTEADDLVSIVRSEG